MKILYLSYLDAEDFDFLARILPNAIKLASISYLSGRSRLVSSLMSLQNYFEVMSEELVKKDDEAIECELTVRQAIDLQTVVDRILVEDSDALHLASLLMSFVVPFESDFICN